MKYLKFYVILTRQLSPKQDKSMDEDVRKNFSCLYPVKIQYNLQFDIKCGKIEIIQEMDGCSSAKTILLGGHNNENCRAEN